MDQDATTVQAQTRALTFGSGIIFGNGILPNRGNLDSVARPFLTAAEDIHFEDPGLINPFNHTNPNFRPFGPEALASGTSILVAIPPADGFFEPAPFVGALGPDPAQDWTLGWTDYSAP
jgi:hypothetical protein